MVFSLIIPGHMDLSDATSIMMMQTLLLLPQEAVNGQGVSVERQPGSFNFIIG